MSLRSARSRSAAALIAIVIACVIGGARARGEVDRNIYRSATVGVEIVFPADWAVSDQASYPYLLATAIDRVLGGRMTLSLERLKDGEKLRDCAERNRTTLKKLGFKLTAQGITQHPTGALVFEIGTPDGRGVVRQAYRAFDERGPVFVLTLSAPRENMQRYRRAFDDSLRGLTRTSLPAPGPKPGAPANGAGDENAPGGPAAPPPAPATDEPPTGASPG
jgi:hypothetical protein